MNCNAIIRLKQEAKAARYNIPVISKKQIDDVETRIIRNATNKIRDEVDEQVREREYQAGTRAECMVFVALIRAFGFGKKRLYRVWREMESMLEDLSDYKDLDVMDEMLFRTLENKGMDVKTVFKEYFEAEEHFKIRKEREEKFLNEHKEYAR